MLHVLASLGLGACNSTKSDNCGNGLVSTEPTLEWPSLSIERNYP
jgi:hypothetical protein